MKVGHLYELEFPYEEGQGSSIRPVLIIVVNVDENKVLGLKVTRSDNTKHEHRLLVKNSPNANFREDSDSYVQYDRYAFFDNVNKISRGELSEEDLRDVILAFKEHHGV